MNFSIHLQELLKGKTYGRTLMNLALSHYTLSGQILDIGGGKKPSYLRFLKKSADSQINNIDFDSLQSDLAHFDLEKDKLPSTDNNYDYVLMFNILEHIYNHRFLLSEAYRVLKAGGQVIGYVPFMIAYHPDPHDYWRYTHETLEKLFSATGFKDIKIAISGRGPLMVNYENIMVYWPVWLRILFFPFYYCLDTIMLALKPKLRQRSAIGYLFTMTK